MAEVFVGSTMGAEGFSRKVAIKRVLPGASYDPSFARLFVAEAQISSQLVHPNIVSVLDFDRDAQGRLFLVMELVDGKDLDALIGSGLLPLPVVIFVIAEVLRGLGFAHDLPMSAGLRGVVHRDISPHNVLLSWEGAVKISDFGIAKARAASEATASVFLKGKPAYMSPEQVNGQPLDGRSDLFAVGAMLWEMLMGRRLFLGKDMGATLGAVLSGQIPRPRALLPDLPKDLERVTMKLLERDLPARYATAEDAITDLMNCADAPRSGREALMTILAERFPDSAPVRQRIARAREIGTRAAPLARMVPPYAGPPPAAGAGALVATPAAVRLGLGTVMTAPTRTLAAPPQPHPRLARLLLILAVSLASALASFAIASAVKHQPAPRSHSAPDPRPAIDTANPLDAVTPIDLGRPAPPESSANTVQPTHPMAENSRASPPRHGNLPPRGPQPIPKLTVTPHSRLPKPAHTAPQCQKLPQRVPPGGIISQYQTPPSTGCPMTTIDWTC